jgi:hypothetical protein
MISKVSELVPENKTVVPNNLIFDTHPPICSQSNIEENSVKMFRPHTLLSTNQKSIALDIHLPVTIIKNVQDQFLDQDHPATDQELGNINSEENI